MRTIVLLLINTVLALGSSLSEADISSLIKPYYSDHHAVKILQHVEENVNDYYVVQFKTYGAGYGSCGSAVTTYVMWLQYNPGEKKIANKFEVVLDDSCHPESSMQIKRQSGMMVIGKRIFVPMYIFDDSHPQCGVQNIEFYD